MALAANDPSLDGFHANPGEDRYLALSDGRKLGYAQFAKPRESPSSRSTDAGSRLMSRLVHEPARHLGLRIVAPDRPGFGLSDYQENRTLIGWTEDVRALAGSLGLDRSPWPAFRAAALTLRRARRCCRKGLRRRR